ncbi:hypothetical protein DXG01_016610 [Tephrocybe rancida]|nr:hypothetical protein DXG01_016610 [Tephrocybe rancida]
MQTPSPDYQVIARLKGAKGIVNVLLFSNDGKHLYSAGHDGSVRIWNCTTFQCEQLLQNEHWGVITSLAYLNVEPPVERLADALCIGSARGTLTLCPKALDSQWFVKKDSVTEPAFQFNDSVEALAFDPLNKRLFVASHSGQLRMYAFQAPRTLTVIWKSTMSSIPRAPRFFGGLAAMRKPQKFCGRRSFRAAWWSGNAALSVDESTLLVGNLNTGAFDVYRFPSTIPHSSLPDPATRLFTRDIVFAEQSKIAVGGSDTGVVLIVDLADLKTVQKLTVSPGDLVQAVAAVTVDGVGHLIAGAPSIASSDIVIAQKKFAMAVAPVNGSTNPVTHAYPSFTRQELISITCVVVFALLSYPIGMHIETRAILKAFSGAGSVMQAGARLFPFSRSAPLTQPSVVTTVHVQAITSTVTVTYIPSTVTITPRPASSVASYPGSMEERSTAQEEPSENAEDVSPNDRQSTTIDLS